MSTYNPGHAGGPAGYDELGRIRGGGHAPGLEALMDIAGRLTETLRTEYPGLVSQGEVIERELALSAEDGLPPNRGRIRSALEHIAIGAAAGTGSLTFTQHLTHALDL
ncbi:hypothetical protein GCM10010503_46720 [Streptomyces lucensis JCM 4490]|uniref:Uncharacterized protein n=1 Tax=Streptomyces lucensis JCM 4490 TaxID=1306176 RepID=A0A918MSC0_9ACTN|nr:hypothetical protein [Streptomyces lucensis]GGW64186.1 hypothetical protein GCM10010503_46720 [Streptomyces lucensis JCM 4490]